MRFVVLMALREVRASWRRLLFFFLCVAIGVGAIVLLRSIIQNVRTELVRESRTLISADVVVATNRPWTPELRADLESRFAAAPIAARQETIELASMVRPAGESGSAVARMVELRGVQQGFPFYGTVVLQGGVPFSHDLLVDRGALVRPELLAQLGLQVGDRIVIGGQAFTIRGVIVEEPGRRVGSFSLGSRVLVDYDDLQRTGLLSFGSRASYKILLRMPEAGVDALTKRIRADFRTRFVTVTSFRATEDQIGDDLNRAENYLSLVGFVILVLGGIGVWSVTRVFVRQKIRSVAILKCVGATTRQVLAAYVLQVVFLGLAGSAMGVALARLGIAAIPARVAAALGASAYRLTASASAQGVAVGLLVSLLFSLVPLLEVRRVKPLLLIRGAAAGGEAGVRWWTPAGLRAWAAALDRVQAAAAVLVVAALVAVASWQAASLRVGLYVCGGFAGIAFVLHLVSTGVVGLVRPIARARWFPLRHAVLSLGRPGNQTRVILLAVGIGSFFVIGVRSLQANLLQQFTLELGSSGADMFLIEILPSQVGGVRAFLDGHQASGAAAPRLIPVLRARVTGVHGGTTALDTYEDVRRQGPLSREFTITYRDHLEANEKIVDGAFWSTPTPAGGMAEVSIERGLHDRARVEVGDMMRFDVLGRVLDARVTSVRSVEWEDARSGGFMFVFRPGPLDKAPQTYIAILQAPPDPAARGRFQRDLVEAFPNVSAIDVREILATVQQAVANVTLAVSIVGAVALVSGILILAGAVAMTKFQRVYEAAILRTLGASTRTLAAMLALEYGGLGLLAGLVGAGGAMALTWGVSRHVFDIPWHPAPGLAALGAVVTTVLVGVVGVASSYDALRKKPLGTLRAE
ncbi:MAG TPA: FtsX-like permease family protein [Vicinamibacterales bacterium]|jgi:putative ABC transport system permease protein